MKSDQILLILLNLYLCVCAESANQQLKKISWARRSGPLRHCRRKSEIGSLTRLSWKTGERSFYTNECKKRPQEPPERDQNENI